MRLRNHRKQALPALSKNCRRTTMYITYHQSQSWLIMPRKVARQISRHTACHLMCVDATHHRIHDPSKDVLEHYNVSHMPATPL